MKRVQERAANLPLQSWVVNTYARYGMLISQDTGNDGLASQNARVGRNSHQQPFNQLSLFKQIHPDIRPQVPAPFRIARGVQR